MADEVSTQPEVSIVYDERFERAYQAAAQHIDKVMGTAFLLPNGIYRRFNDKQMLKMGRSLRQKGFWELPILPGAVTTFQSISASREWMVSGKPRSVSQAVEYFNLAQTQDPATGFVDLGFEQFLKRRVMDYLIVGRTAYYSPKKGRQRVLEYLDPCYLDWERDRNVTTPVRPREKVWLYNKTREMSFEDVTLGHPVPFGSNGFISPIFPILPTAALSWLLREHNSASLDGRKIRDIIFVSNPSLKNAISEAITIQIALWTGGDASELGIPVVEVNNPMGKSVQDMIATLGLSKIPENFKEEEFTFMYVNEIAANLGLALRNFWNNERTTNRALEVVQEQRQQLKGPASFVRSEQRLYNRVGGIMDQFSSASRRTRFGFIEEVDSSSAKDNAEILKNTAEALEKIASVFGATIEMKSYLAWMQFLRALPNDLELIKAAPQQIVQDSDQQTNQADEQTQDGEADPTAFDNAVKTLFKARDPGKMHYFLDYDEITMDGEGHVIDRRVKTFSIEKTLQAEMQAEKELSAKRQKISAEEAYELAVDAASVQNQNTFRRVFPRHQKTIETWAGEQYLFEGALIGVAATKCLAGEPLNEIEQLVIDEVVMEVVDDVERIDVQT